MWKELEKRIKKNPYELAGGNEYVIKRAKLGVSFSRIAKEMGLIWRSSN
ncbi:hypothetical protein [Methanobrevibacter sp. YE315]|nr:hypothetical protein [Methanobrevibacter sp. YE315]